MTTATTFNLSRQSNGRFVPTENSLHSKTLGLRLHKAEYEQLHQLAETLGKPVSELSRQIIEDWLHQQEKNDPSH